MRVLSLAVFCSAGNALAATVDDAAVLDWVSRHAQPLTSVDRQDDFTDLRSLGAAIGAARVVSFGEPIHLGQEFLALRNRLFKYLVLERGFTAIALETGFTDGVIVDDYVLGRGPAAAPPTRHAFSFAEVEFEQNRALIEWMRAYNALPTTHRKVRFYGHSMVGRGEWDSAASRVAIDAALSYVRSVDAGQAQSMIKRLESLLQKSVRDYDALSSAERDELTAGLADVVSLFERRRVEWQAHSSLESFERGYRSAINAMQIDADRRVAGARGAAKSKIVGGVDLNQNDAAMAANVRWMLEREGRDGRIFVFAHNGHVGRCAIRSEYEFTSMGEHLRAMLGGDLVVIGSTAQRGLVGLPDKPKPLQPSPPDTPTAILARVGLPLYSLNLNSLPEGPVGQWWNRTLRFRSNHGTDDLNPAECFDALVFIERVTPARTLPTPDP